MTDVSQFEGRITSALDRIAAAMDGMGAAGTAAQTADGDAAALREALEVERTANAQLEERVKAIRDTQDTQVKTLEDRVAALEAQVEASAQDLAARDAELHRLSQVNTQLRDNNQALREANETGVGDPNLINDAMQAELASLRARRDADRAELDAILGELKPLVEGTANA